MIWTSSAHCQCSGARGCECGCVRRAGVARLARWVRFGSHHFRLRVSLTRFSSSWPHALLTPVPFRPRDASDDDDGDGWKMEKLSASITGLSWSSVSLPLDVIVSKFRLPTLVRLSHGKKAPELLNVTLVINGLDRAREFVWRCCAASRQRFFSLLPNQS